MRSDVNHDHSSVPWCTQCSTRPFSPTPHSFTREFNVCFLLYILSGFLSWHEYIYCLHIKCILYSSVLPILNGNRIFVFPTARTYFGRFDKAYTLFSLTLINGEHFLAALLARHFIPCAKIRVFYFQTSRVIFVSVVLCVVVDGAWPSRGQSTNAEGMCNLWIFLNFRVPFHDSFFISCVTIPRYSFFSNILLKICLFPDFCCHFGFVVLCCGWMCVTFTWLRYEGWRYAQFGIFLCRDFLFSVWFSLLRMFVICDDFVFGIIFPWLCIIHTFAQNFITADSRFHAKRHFSALGVGCHSLDAWQLDGRWYTVVSPSDNFVMRVCMNSFHFTFEFLNRHIFLNLFLIFVEIFLVFFQNRPPLIMNPSFSSQSSDEQQRHNDVTVTLSKLRWRHNSQWQDNKPPTSRWRRCY